MRLRVKGLGFGVLGFGRDVQHVKRCGVWVAGFGVQGAGFRVWVYGLGFKGLW